MVTPLKENLPTSRGANHDSTSRVGWGKPLERYSAPPLTMSCPLRVTRNDEIPNLVTIKPLTAPIAPAAARLSRTATGSPTPLSLTRMNTSRGVNPNTAPAERSNAGGEQHGHAQR